MPNDFETPETSKCPWCGTKRPIVPMPDKPGREAAYCNCRGDDNLPFFERSIALPVKAKGDYKS